MRRTSSKKLILKMMAKSFEYSEIIILITILLIPLFFIINKLKKPHAPPLPPSPHPWRPPLLSAVDHFLHPPTPASLADLARSHGPLVRLDAGLHRHIIASSPAAAAAILRANDRALSSRAVPHAVPLSPPQVERLSFWGDPASGGWRSIRGVCKAELFSAAALEAHARRREEKAAEMVGRLRRREGTADVGAAAYAVVVNMFGNAFFSRDVLDLDGEADVERVRGLLRGIIGAISAPNLSEFFPFLGRFDVHGLRKKHKEFSMEVWGIWREVLEERRRRPEIRHEDFMDSLICRGFEDDQINQLLEELLTAGIDTTTATITRTMKELIATPRSLAKLKQELDAGFGSSPIGNLAYLQACIKETLRLHPPAPLMLSHRASETCHVMGYVIPKDAHVSVNVWAIGRDPAVWEEPLEYRPERFLDSSVDFKGNDFEFLPFGAGRRICPGVPMAAKIVPLVVATLVYYFDWENTKGRSVDEEFRATSLMKEPLMMIPRARK